MTPTQKMKKGFETKEKLVDAILGKLEKREGESKDDLRKRMLRVSSKKLLRLKARSEKS